MTAEAHARRMRVYLRDALSRLFASFEYVLSRSRETLVQQVCVQKTIGRGHAASIMTPVMVTSFPNRKRFRDPAHISTLHMLSSTIDG